MTLKRPVTLNQAQRSPKAAARRESFCARMGGMKTKLTGKKKQNDPNSRINQALQAWDCDMPQLLNKKHVAKKTRNPVPPSSRAGIKTATRNDIEKAADLYQRFSGHDAEEIGRVSVPAIPKVGVAIGEVDGILYSTVRDGKHEKYIHKFHKADKPLFVVSPDGKQLFLIGGCYTFTERGIVDRNDK